MYVHESKFILAIYIFYTPNILLTSVNSTIDSGLSMLDIDHYYSISTPIFTPTQKKKKKKCKFFARTK